MNRQILVPSLFQDSILSHLTTEDDAEFWATATAVLLHDVEFAIAETRSKPLYIQIGACSHWLRPHQTRWTAAGGFAWPTGYGGLGYSRLGLPEFDWSVLLKQDFTNQSWQLVEKITDKRAIVFRAALPTRTIRHAQAAIHTQWQPRSPSNNEVIATRFYGFRKINSVWQCVASS